MVRLLGTAKGAGNMVVRTIKWVLVLGACAAGAGFLPQPVSACSCALPAPVPEALAASGAVFSGTVRSSRTEGDARVFVVDVLRVWKGGLARQVEVTTLRWGSMCGIELQVGESYLIYGGGNAQGVDTGLCTRTRSLARAADDLAQLGEGSEPADADLPTHSRDTRAERRPTRDTQVPAEPAAASMHHGNTASQGEHTAAEEGGCAVTSDSQPYAQWLPLLWVLLRRRRARR